VSFDQPGGDHDVRHSELEHASSQDRSLDDEMGCHRTDGADPLAVLGLEEDGSGAVPA
jgi:hypothetical protein